VKKFHEKTIYIAFREPLTSPKIESKKGGFEEPKRQRVV